MRDAVGRVLRIAVAHGYRIRLIALHRAILAQVAGPCSGETPHQTFQGGPGRSRDPRWIDFGE